MRVDTSKADTATKDTQIGSGYTHDPITIRGEIRSYYENLNKQNEPADSNRKIKPHFLPDEIFLDLSDEERAECDTAISNTELTNALNLLNKDSAPGSNGLPPSFYKQFWGKLKAPYYKYILQLIENGELPFTLKWGVITLIHKGKDLVRNNLGNYRPITLTNTDYKMFTKALAA